MTQHPLQPYFSRLQPYDPPGCSLMCPPAAPFTSYVSGCAGFDATLVTLGCPRTGNADFAAWVQSYAYVIYAYLCFVYARYAYVIYVIRDVTVRDRGSNHM